LKQKQPESTEIGSTQEVSDSYIGRIRARIKPNISFTSSVESNQVAEVEVRWSDDKTEIRSKAIRDFLIPFTPHKSASVNFLDKAFAFIFAK
jgi:hypothetical protein